jgi:hypothetical protein
MAALVAITMPETFEPVWVIDELGRWWVRIDTQEFVRLVDFSCEIIEFPMRKDEKSTYKFLRTPRK